MVNDSEGQSLIFAKKKNGGKNKKKNTSRLAYSILRIRENIVTTNPIELPNVQKKLKKNFQNFLEVSYMEQ